MSEMHIAVVGGGAAGFFGAIQAARQFPQLRITILEALPQPLTKVRISGGGRCNVTHHCFDPLLLSQHYPRGGQVLRGLLTRFQPRDVLDWFAQEGVTLKTEPDGRIFPCSDDSSTITTALVRAAQRAHITIQNQHKIHTIRRQGDGFHLEWAGGGLVCDRVLLATGSSPSGYAIATQLGHRLIPPVPALFTLHIPDPALWALAGVSLPQVRLKWLGEGLPRLAQKHREQQGALLITHWGLSGPVVLRLSSWLARFLHACQYQGQLQVHWLPAWGRQKLYEQCQLLRTQVAAKTLGNYRPVRELPQRLWHYLLACAHIPQERRWGELSGRELEQLLLQMTAKVYPVTGKGIFKEEFVTCGGVPWGEVDSRTLHSRVCPGLYLAGEVLDMDGLTGGFNLQAAWTTGWIAGQALGARNEDD
ncbi:NAD(P)/FAD-dependent oxidoreductase [Synechococcus sp. C9]|uniref:NAD(P)/FAD-dependent oxidoreductase n=1 Tax=Synechococcus sp. C9 TaxID=102119 RepID=UPI001FF553F8|nr:NAD(P)/FAD-dependent oxidoreductase [Synechococcus sp. C9]